MQKLIGMWAVVALALAVMVPAASAAGWRLERANSSTPYVGPVSLALSSGTVLKWKWTNTSGGTTSFSCTMSSGAGSVTAAGAAPALAGTLTSWSATGNPVVGGNGCANSAGAPSPFYWTGSKLPWKFSVGSFGAGLPKLVIQNPTVNASPTVAHSAAVLEGKIVNPPNGTQTARVQFNDGNDTLGLNNTLTNPTLGTSDLDAEYTLIGLPGGVPQNLKVVWVP